MANPLHKPLSHRRRRSFTPSPLTRACFSPITNMGFSYRVARASEYLAITGYRINDIKLAKKALILPGQSCSVFDISPVNYTFDVQAMSAEKLPFILPAVFIIGPRTEDPESLLKYARLISPHDKLSNHVKELVQGVIEGETRVLAASMTMEEIFKGTELFKQEIFGKIQLELNQFGLAIYNANVKQLVDVRGHEYFSYLGQKAQHEAANQARIDVAEAKMKGDLGSKEREGTTERNASKINAETTIYSKQREGEGRKAEIIVDTEVKVFQNLKEAELAEANAELAKRKAGWAKQAQVKEVEASKAVAIREAELQIEVERKNAVRQTEKLKAEYLSKSIVEYEMKVQEANWELYRMQKQAEAALYEQEKQAEACRATAEADLFARQKQADGELYAKKKEAEVMVALAESHGIYLRTLLEVLGGTYGQSSNGGTTELAGLADNGQSSNVGMKGLAGLYKMLPPLLDIIKEQTGMVPPAWTGKLLEQQSSTK